MVEHIYVEVRPVLTGDSLWFYGPITKLLAAGNEVTVVCNERNEGMFQFFKDYCVGAERLQVVRDAPNQSTSVIGGGCPNDDMLLPLRKPLEPIVTEGPYLVFQPESIASGKRKRDLRPVTSPIRGYSVGLGSEYVQPGTASFHERPISEVARLIYHSVGVVAIFSSMSLLASFLGKKLLCVGYDGINITGTHQTGFLPDRWRVEEGSPEAIENAINQYLGPF